MEVWAVRSRAWVLLLNSFVEVIPCPLPGTRNVVIKQPIGALTVAVLDSQ